MSSARPHGQMQRVSEKGALLHTYALLHAWAPSCHLLARYAYRYRGAAQLLAQCRKTSKTLRVSDS